MTAPGFYVADLAETENLWLDPSGAHHAVQVLRMKPGDFLRLTNGRGVSVNARILEADKKGCRVEMKERVVEPEPARHRTVAISLLKNASRFEWFLEKATELGIRRIVPLLCRRTEKQHFRRDRMDSILASALVQSQQSWLPMLDDPTPFERFALMPQDGPAGICFCGDGKKMALSEFPGLHTPESTMAIGPEGDFTEEEMQLALSNGFVAISLGRQRLRTETAALTAAVMLQQSAEIGL